MAGTSWGVVEAEGFRLQRRMKKEAARVGAVNGTAKLKEEEELRRKKAKPLVSRAETWAVGDKIRKRQNNEQMKEKVMCEVDSSKLKINESGNMSGVLTIFFINCICCNVPKLAYKLRASISNFLIFSFSSHLRGECLNDPPKHSVKIIKIFISILFVYLIFNLCILI